MKQKFKNNWSQIREELQGNWSRLSGRDIAEINGDLDQFKGKLWQRYGFTRSRIEKEVRGYLSGFETS